MIIDKTELRNETNSYWKQKLEKGKQNHSVGPVMSFLYIYRIIFRKSDKLMRFSHIKSNFQRLI